MKKPMHLTALIVVCLVISGCASWFADYGKIKHLTGDRKKQVTIDTLIENWKDYNIYYAGLSIKLPLGIIFDPKGNQIHEF